MDETLSTKLQELADDIIDAGEAITRLVEAENPVAEDIGRCHERVAEIAARYAELLAAAPEDERDQVDRVHGRKVIDLKRQAGTLPARAAGRSTARATDVPPEGGWPLRELRAPGKRMAVFEPPRRGERGGPHVGGSIEAWCGPCGGLTEHTVVAMVGGEPKQVICVACRGKHGYRTSPARSNAKAGTVAAGARVRRPLTKEEIEAEKRREQRAELQRELAEATEVRPFSRRDRYRAGEIIQHPEHGRGKIENVLRSSLLVRFPSGLKSLSLL